MRRIGTWLIAGLTMVFASGYGMPGKALSLRFSPDEIGLAASLALPSLVRPPADPSNHIADHPAAVRLGAALFFDPRLSANGTVACASCHRPEHAFADVTQFSTGLAPTERNTPSLVGSAWSRWYFSDGRSDSHWAQALVPLLHAGEQGLTRTGMVKIIRTHYRHDYEKLFGRLPHARLQEEAGAEGNETAQLRWKKMHDTERHAINRVLANVGKSLAAYQRTLLPTRTRFDDFATALSSRRPDEAVRLFNRDEIQGFRLFVGSARCIQCHNGPMLSNYQFHNTGLHESDQVLHMGHFDGLQRARGSDFSCLGRYSDDKQNCPSRFVGNLRDMVPGGFKTPTLRNLTLTAPYMRTGEFTTLDEVIDHYNQGGRSEGRPGVIGNELTRLALNPTERAQLKAFLLTLSPLSLASEPGP